MERLQHFIIEMQAKGVTVLLCGVRPDFAQAMHNLRFQDFFLDRLRFSGRCRARRFRDLGCRPQSLRPAGRRPMPPLSAPHAAGTGQWGVLLSDLKIYDPRIDYVRFHRLSCQIAPRPAESRIPLSAVAITASDWASFGIRVMHQFNLPRPTPLAGQVLNDLLQPPAIGNRPVQKPKGLANAEPSQGLPYEFQRGLRFVHLAIAAMHAGHVAQHPVAGQEEHAAGERRSIVVNRL